MSHSDFQQDEFVAAILGGMRGGYFIESGAYDGLRASNTLLLEREYGWRGMCVEANDALFRQLVANRRCACVHACLYRGDATVAFLESADSAGGIVGEYAPEQTAFVQRVHAPPAGADGAWITVPKTTRTLGSLLDADGAPPVIDYWSLDTEGSELAILETFPFERYRVRVLTVEHCWLPQRRADLGRLLGARGMRFVTSLGIDDCYVADWSVPLRRMLGHMTGHMTGRMTMPTAGRRRAGASMLPGRC